jgi:hypothetical protein
MAFESWRDLLRTVTATPKVKERLAGELGLNSMTLTRWVLGETDPRPENLRRLRYFLSPEYRSQFDQLVKLEYPELTFSTEQAPMAEFGVELFRSVLEARATSVDLARFYTISQRVIQHAIRQLDPEREGIAIMVVRCMPPVSDGLIYSLRETEGQGTPPWESNLSHKAQFLGAESLAGHAVSTMRPEAVNQVNAPVVFPAIPAEHEVSAMAAPIVFANRVAGCLLVSSAQPNYFISQPTVTQITDYALLLSLAFEPGEFYPPERISLRMMPPLSIQRPLLDQFQPRVLALLHESSKTEHPLSRAQAELVAWQKLEAEVMASQFVLEPVGRNAEGGVPDEQR